MKRLLRLTGLFSLATGVFLLFRLTAAAGDNSIMDRIGAADEPFDSSEITSVYDLPLKTVRAEIPYQGGTFRVLTRKDSVGRFRCSVCHTDKIPQARDSSLFTHGDIKISHGREKDGLSCADCHQEKEKDFLVGKKGENVDFDHSYLLCGKCHFRQLSDWVGGAHGKRVKYWAGERVINNCATCHNPHSPRFEKRMPAAYSLPLDE
jgi:formate-dependent nitrite reductase cytochrome c552 subunit